MAKARRDSSRPSPPKKPPQDGTTHPAGKLQPRIRQHAAAQTLNRLIHREPGRRLDGGGAQSSNETCPVEEIATFMRSRGDFDPTMRIVLRLFSLVALTLAVIAGVIDAIRSVAADRLELTALGAAWRELDAGSLAGVRDWSADAALPMVETTVSFVLLQPAVAVCLALAFVLYALAYRQPRRRRRFARR